MGISGLVDLQTTGQLLQYLFFFLFLDVEIMQPGTTARSLVVLCVCVRVYVILPLHRPLPHFIPLLVFIFPFCFSLYRFPCLLSLFFSSALLFSKSHDNNNNSSNQA